MMGLDDSLIERIEQRFDKVDKDNKAIEEKVDAIQVQVDRHAVYWDVTKWIAAPSAVAILGYLGLTKK
jgi:hypothetical protein